MTTARTLHVRCATWEQVDVFLARKLRKGRFLSLKVPFPAQVGIAVTIGLELPNQLVMAIEGTVQRASAVEGDAQRTWIEVELGGLTEEVRGRIRSMIAQDGTASSAHRTPVVAPSPPRRPTSQVLDELPADERELFQTLSSELRRLRQAAVHEVLGVEPDAGPDEVRGAWKDLVRRVHPDLVARRGAPAISHLAEELTILSNRAYDRLRAALVAEGRATAAGPVVAAPPGWLVGFDDIQSGDRSIPIKAPRAKTPAQVASAPPSGSGPAKGSTMLGGEAFETRARAMLARGEAEPAREVLAAALVVFPRSKPLRSLYYVATALAALDEGELMLAQSQLETALAHHEQCKEASQLLDLIRNQATRDHEAVRRIFQ